MTDLIPTHTPTPAQDYQAATAYLASLKSAVGRRGMLSQLRKVARILRAPDIDAVNWATLNAANVRAILSALSTQNLAPASIALQRCEIGVRGLVVRLLLLMVGNHLGHGWSLR